MFIGYFMAVWTVVTQISFVTGKLSKHKYVHNNLTKPYMLLSSLTVMFTSHGILEM